MAARESRLNHPRGGVFIQLHSWAVRSLGRDAAAILGALDFLDRAQDEGGALVASRAGLLANLEGLVSRYALDGALKRLAELGLVRCVEQEVLLKKNLTRSHWYALDAEAINEFIKKQNSGVLNSERRRSESRTDSGSEFGTDSGSEHSRPSVKEKEEKRVEQKGLPALPLSLKDELELLAADAARRNPKTDRAADWIACSAAAKIAAELGVPDAVAAEAVRGVRERGGWPREAAAAILQAATTRKADAIAELHGRAFQAVASGNRYQVRGGIAVSVDGRGNHPVDAHFLAAIAAGEIVEVEGDDDEEAA